MPIFMDRHDMPGVTAEEVARAHRLDLDIQASYGVNFMAYWYDRRRHTAFCLVDAPDAATADWVHREAHGNVAHAIIPVDPATVEAFLGRVCDPQPAAGRPEPGIGAGLRAIMFTDIVGSTEMTARLGDLAALDLVRGHDAIVRRALGLYGGREVKHTGDGIMASFETVADAVRAGADIQRRVDVFADTSPETLALRIGIDAGEPVEHHRDLFGATVQRAARLCDAAEPGGIIVSDRVRRLSEHPPQHFIPLGRRPLRGFAEPQDLFRYAWRA